MIQEGTRTREIIPQFLMADETTGLTVELNSTKMTDPMIKDGKRLENTNMMKQFISFLITCFILVPIFLCFLLPCAIVCVIFQQIINLFTSPDKDTTKPLGEPSDTKYLTAKDKREFDLVVFGATGFTGKMVAAHIAKTYGVGKTVKWAIAGRSKGKLDAVAKDLGCDVPIIIADSGDVNSLSTMVRSTKVIVSTAGPFLLYGSELVRQCSMNGTHYCDITGEIDWIRIMIDLYSDAAEKSGAKIIPLCGHDCIPWDLSVLALSNEFKKRGDTLTTVNCYDEIRGSASGGTVATIFTALSNRRKYKAALGFDPLLRTSEGTKCDAHYKPDVQMTLGYSSEYQSWVGFFIMSMVMANCVRRSNVLLGYSKKLTYSEARVHANFFSAFNEAVGLIIFSAFLVIPPLSWLALKLGVMPSPGEGPSAATMDKGFLKITSFGHGADKSSKPIKAIMYFPTDPGYRDTARMLAESGLLLALEQEKTAKNAGFHTPASGLGMPLLDRLVATGSSFEILNE